MEEQQRLEMAARITELRERSPYHQPDVARKLNIGLRAYQKLEARGTGRFERCEELAKIHKTWTARHPEWRHASADWIWDGKVRADTPDLMAALSRAEEPSQLDRVEQKLDEVLSLLRRGDVLDLAIRETEKHDERKPQARPSQPAPPSTDPG